MNKYWPTFFKIGQHEFKLANIKLDWTTFIKIEQHEFKLAKIKLDWTT